MKNMQVSIKDGHIVIKLPFNEEGKESKTGKSLVHATTNGNQPEKVGDLKLMIGVNVFSKKED